MGYKIGTLASLPVIPSIDLYVFLLHGNGWDGGLDEKLRKNFDELAMQVGPNTAVVMPHKGHEITGELVEIMPNFPIIGQLISYAEKNASSILILGSHPKKLKQTDLLLFGKVEDLVNNFNSLENFLTELCLFCKNNNDEFIKKFELRDTVLSSILNSVEIKPNIAGFGFNFNEFIGKVKNTKIVEKIKSKIC